MKVIELVLKKVMRTIKKKEFWFTIIVYPLFAIGYQYVKKNRQAYEMVNRTGIWYFVVSYMIALYIVFMVAYEIIEKKLRHKIQGDKLKQKQENWG